MKYTICSIEPFIYDYAQCFKVKLAERGGDLNFKLTEYWGVKSTELESLVDSYLEPIYYEIGERTANGKVITERNKFYNIKSWKLHRANKNKSPSLNFLTIREVHLLTSPYDLIHISVIEQSEPFLYVSRNLTEDTGLSPEQFKILKGAKIAPVCYVDGDISDLYSWPIYSKPGYNQTIVKSLNIRFETPLKLDS